MPIKKFSLKFSRNCRKAECLFDQASDVGVVVSQHEGPDDEEGERVDMEPRGDGVFCYKVHDGFTIVVRLGLEQDATAKLLQPVLVLASGLEQHFDPFELFPGGIFQLPQNLEMDPGEAPNFWLLKENGELVLTLMIHVDN